MVPDDPLLTALRDFVGRPFAPPRRAVDAVDTASIRRWVEAFGDDNPIYVDDAAARQTGRAGVIAPPAMLPVWTMQGYRETLAGPPPDEKSIFRTLVDAGFGATPGTNLRHEYFHEVRPGDWLRMETTVAGVSSRKETRLGPGYFIDIMANFIGDGGEVVGRQTLRVVAVQPSGSAPQKRDGRSGIGPDSLGVPLPELAITLDRLGVIACTTASRDFRAAHYDPDSARALGFQDVFTDIPTALGFVQRFVTGWSGPGSRVRMVDIRLGSPFYAGDTLRLNGSVDPGGESDAMVRLCGATSLGLHVGGTAVVHRPGT